MTAPGFRVTAADGAARTAVLTTAHGEVETPAFMPVATQGAVKAALHEEVEALGYRLMIANVYHLAVRPGVEAIRRAGGLHRFTGWPGAWATDSGGFQIMSLARLRTVTDEGVTFRAPLDGSRHVFTPERVIAMQEAFGSDLAMPLDECPPYPCSPETSEAAVARTTTWAKRSLAARNRGGGIGALFGIVQGGTDPGLRRRSAEEIAALGFDGHAIGGLSVGEARETTVDAAALTASFLPGDRPRYLMGVGEPGGIVEGIAAGVDLFDCVFPTRVARNGLALTRTGRLVVRNAPAAGEDGPLDPSCRCPACRRHGRAYVRHLIHADEIAGLRLLTLHNLTYMRDLVDGARAAIRDGRFAAWRREILAVWRPAPA